MPASKTRKTRKKRNEDRRRSKPDGGQPDGGQPDGGQPDGGQSRRKSGGQPGRRAARREFPPDQRVVIEKPKSCGTDDCTGHIRVNKYSPQTMHDKPPQPRPRTVEAQCPHWGCGGCGASGIARAGTAVPLRMFSPEKGDAEPDRPAVDLDGAGGRAGGGGEAGGGRQERREEENGEEGEKEEDNEGEKEEDNEGEKEEDNEVVRTLREKLGGGMDVDVDGSVNNFSDDPDKAYSIRLPRTGVFGPNTKVAVVKNHLNRLSVRMNRRSLRDDGVKISAGQTSNIVMDAGRALKPGLLALIALLACARVIHADKTSYVIDGEHWSLWVFFDPLRKIVVYWLTPDGDNAALKRILDAWKGIIVCDGAQVFRRYLIQRCWAHILNEAKYLAGQFPDSESARHVSDRLHKIFHDAKKYRGTRAERIRKRYEFTRRVRAIVEAYRDDPALAEFMTKLDNAAFDLFLFVVETYVPPTNNPAEKLLREPVILRKIRGTLRSAAGAAAFCALMSCKATWEMHGLRVLSEIRRVL